MNVILMGPPGVGKGTQGQRLAAFYRVPVVASGDMFREIRVQDTPQAQQIREYMDRGDYVPDALTIGMVLDRLDLSDARKGFILDGFPRTVPQAEALDQHMDEEGRPIKRVALLEAPSEVILRRLTGRRVCGSCSKVYNQDTNPAKVPGICDVCGSPLIQRTDESPDVQRRRLEVYAAQTAPVAAYYETTGRLKKIDATRKVDEVQADLRAFLSSRTAARAAAS